LPVRDDQQAARDRDEIFSQGPAKNGTAVRFKVKLNGAAPGDDHGFDSGADGQGEVRQPCAIDPRIFQWYSFLTLEWA
jgi:hypothetical protein